MTRWRWGLGAVALVALAIWLWQRGGSKPATTQTQAPSDRKLPTKATHARTPQVAEPPAMPAFEPLPLSAAEVIDDASASAGAFAGTVVDFGTTRPIPGAVVVFEADEQTYQVATDANGAFRFEPPQATEYRVVWADAEGYLPYAPQHNALRIAARPGKVVRGLLFFLTPEVPYVGKVVDRAGSAVVGASIVLRHAGTGDNAQSPLRENFVSDAQGEFEFFARDNSVLEASHATGWGRGIVDGAVQTSHRMVITLAEKVPQFVLAGAVESAVQPHRIANARVTAVRVGEASLPFEAETNAQGEFSIPGLLAGDYEVKATHPGFERNVQSVSIRENTRIDFTLAAGARIVGTVVAPDGKPLPAFSVVVLRPDGIARTPVASLSVFDAHGAFEFSELTPGAYVLIAEAYGHARSLEVAARAELPPAVPSAVQIKLQAGGTVFGRVVDSASQQPLEHARITVEGGFGGDNSAFPTVLSTTTRSDGSFELMGLSPGIRSLMVAAYNHHARIVSRLSVESGARVGPVEVALTAVKPGETPGLELAGLGLALKPDGDAMLVEKVFSGGGGEAAGIAAGDRLLAIDGALVAQLGFDGTIQAIRGPVGTTLVVRIRRANGEVVDVTATRRAIVA